MSATHPLLELRRLLTSETERRGRVVRLEGRQVTIATASGILTAQSGASLHLGQAVSVRDGTAYPVAAPSAVYAL